MICKADFSCRQSIWFKYTQQDDSRYVYVRTHCKVNVQMEYFVFDGLTITATHTQKWNNKNINRPKPVFFFFLLTYTHFVRWTINHCHVVSRACCLDSFCMRSNVKKPPNKLDKIYLFCSVFFLSFLTGRAQNQVAVWFNDEKLFDWIFVYLSQRHAESLKRKKKVLKWTNPFSAKTIMTTTMLKTKNKWNFDMIEWFCVYCGLMNFLLGENRGKKTDRERNEKLFWSPLKNTLMNLKKIDSFNLSFRRTRCL